MRMTAFVIAFVAGIIPPAFAQQAEIEAVNAKWIDFFNKGDFSGIASLYTEDATAFPPGSPMMKGRACNRGNVEKHGGTSGGSETHHRGRKAIRAFCGARDRNLQPQGQGFNSARSHRQICRGVGKGWKRLEARDGYLE